MSIERYAILKAADQIETRPETFNFCETGIPHDCGSPGCALGWIGHFASTPVAGSVLDVAVDFLRLGDHVDADAVFYERMSRLQYGWRDNAHDCAKTLRLYADAHHPRANIPNGYGMPS